MFVCASSLITELIEMDTGIVEAIVRMTKYDMSVTDINTIVSIFERYTERRVKEAVAEVTETIKKAN